MGNVLLFLLFLGGKGGLEIIQTLFGMIRICLWDICDCMFLAVCLTPEGGVADDTVTHLPPLISSSQVDRSCRRGRIGAWLGPEIGECQPEAPGCLL